MIHELKAQEYKLARHVYEGLSYNLVIRSVIEQNTNGRIFVDHHDNPRAALLWNCQDALLLEGSPYHEDFNQSLADVIRRQIIPSAGERLIPMLSLHYFPDGWEKTIQNTILKHLNPEKVQRNLYWFRALQVDWRRRLPKGCAMRPIDAGLLQDPQLKNLDEMRGWIDSFWHTPQDFLSRGAGFCLMKEDTILSWCLSVYAGLQNYELGLATVAPFRGKGYATLTAAACVEYCIERKIIPHWHCYKTNAASIAVAEKVGFEKVMEYPVYRFQTLISDFSM